MVSWGPLASSLGISLAVSFRWLSNGEWFKPKISFISDKHVGNLRYASQSWLTLSNKSVLFSCGEVTWWDVGVPYKHATVHDDDVKRGCGKRNGYYCVHKLTSCKRGLMGCTTCAKLTSVLQCVVWSRKCPIRVKQTHHEGRRRCTARHAALLYPLRIYPVS